QEVHETGTLHRAFSVFLYHDDKMLIQRRAKHKYHSGGLWSNACCSHPTEGLSINESVRQRMYEELQVRCPVEEAFQFIYFHKFGDKMFEYEYDHVFIGEYSGDFKLDPEEAEDAAWIDFNELSKLLREKPETFSIWCLTAMPKVMSIIKEKNR
ncbi:MAG TPA: NUDIX domain-containing protein, partial [Anaerovoracaceae bacterium]|nr:NUDIX domain-containing protein [Anaerovoracaceae bacterium]